MRWAQISIIGATGFLITIGDASLKESVVPPFCNTLASNSVTCSLNSGDSSRANAATPASSNQSKQSLENISTGQKVAGICLLGICAPVNLPKPIENLVENELNNVVKQKMRSLLIKEIPISGSEHEFYKNVANLPGKTFTPQLLPLNTLALDTPIPPGDYEIPVHFYCTKIYSFDGRGNRFSLARLNGRMSDVLSALYARASYDHSVSINDVQTLSWAIQAGVAYGELQDSQRKLVDRLIPEYRDRMEKSFVDRLTGIVDNVSRISGDRLPGFNQLLKHLGPVGDVASSLLEARKQILRTNYSYQALAQEFAPQKDVFLDGGTEETPWSRVQENVYMRFIAPDGALDDGIVQVRTASSISSQLSPKHSSIKIASLSAHGESPFGTTSNITVGSLIQAITQSVGVPEASGSQAITASLLPGKNDEKCDLNVVLFQGFNGASNNPNLGGQPRIAPLDGIGALQNRLQAEMLKYPTIRLQSQVYTWDGRRTALDDMEIIGKNADSIVLIGHSYGASGANAFARMLGEWKKSPFWNGIKVDMLIQIDTVSRLTGPGSLANTFPSNVNTLINYFQTIDTNLPIERNIPRAENINATERFDRTLIHTTIDDNEALHQDIIARILEKTRSCRERAASKK